MNSSAAVSRVKVSADGHGVVSHAGLGMLRKLADLTGLSVQVTAALADTYKGPWVHAPGDGFADLAAAVADGADYAQVQQEQAGGAKGAIPDHSPLVVEGMEPGTTRVTEDILAAVAPDKIAIDAAFNDPEHGKDFIRDLMTHNWSGDSAAKGLFHFNDGDQYVTPGEGHTGQVVAERSGNIMEAVARAMSGDDARNLMMNIPGTEHNTMSAGELNPQLLQEISRSMAPT